MNEDGDAAVRALGEEGGANALAWTPVEFVADDAHGEMDLAGVRFRAGRDRVEPVLERAERGDQILGTDAGGGKRRGEG